MDEFEGRDKARKYSETLRNPGGKLFDMQIVKDEKTQMSSARPVEHPVIRKVLVLLAENGYGQDYITDKRREDLDKMNAFSKIIQDGLADPSSATAAIAQLDKKSVSQFLYMVNKRAQYDPRFIGSFANSKCLLGLLERAMELGSNKAPPIDYAALARPAPVGP